MPNFNLGISGIANIVLSLLLFFQWFRDRAREDSVKNSLLAIREMVERASAANSPDVLSAIDATLATLGGRKPYRERCKKILANVARRFKKIDEASLPEISPIQKDKLEQALK